MFRLGSHVLYIFLLAGIAGCATTTRQTFTSEYVPSTSNIFGAGNPSSLTPHPGYGGGGTAAPGFNLEHGAKRYLEILVTSGHASLSRARGTSIPIPLVPDGLDLEGGPAFNLDTDILSCQGISGIGLARGSGFLAGVFVNDSVPANPAPARLMFTNNSTPDSISVSFTTLEPALNQTFFIGDGFTGNGTGARQRFIVPEGATRLFLGFADADYYRGLPGAYQDNTGGLTVSFQIVRSRPLDCCSLFSARSDVVREAE